MTVSLPLPMIYGTTLVLSLDTLTPMRFSRSYTPGPHKNFYCCWHLPSCLWIYGYTKSPPDARSPRPETDQVECAFINYGRYAARFRFLRQRLGCFSVRRQFLHWLTGSPKKEKGHPSTASLPTPPT